METLEIKEHQASKASMEEMVTGDVLGDLVSLASLVSLGQLESLVFP